MKHTRHGPTTYLVVYEIHLPQIEKALSQNRILYNTYKGSQPGTVNIQIYQNDLEKVQTIAQAITANARRPIGVLQFLMIVGTALIVGLICKHILHLTDAIVFVVAILLPVGYLALSDFFTIFGMSKIAYHQLPKHPEESEQHYQQRLATGRRLGFLPILGAIVVGIVSFGILFLFTYVVWISQ